jgi:hypothetical protein
MNFKFTNSDGNSRTRCFLFAFITGALFLLSGNMMLGNKAAGETSLRTDEHSQKNSQLPKKLKLNSSILISYGDLVDQTVLTHSGESIGAIIPKIPKYDDQLKGLVQPYLESFSILCNDVILAISKADTLPYVNVISYYPIGSEQPAWASLFREGNFQLYFNNNTIRLFVKGVDPIKSFNLYQPTVRHAIKDIIDRYSNSIKNIEVFAFINDYAKMEIRLNTTPAAYSIRDINLSAKHKPIDLEGLETFLDVGVSLEAVEIDKENNLFFYGKKDNEQTLANSKLSLADIAVIYRSVFHYGNNPPYISLDKNEDNRFAKVNFGGLLENTHVGYVVLEADKLFKTIGTGIDPNTHEISKSRLAHYVPGFLTEDERSLLNGDTEGRSQIRYWFYPDSIGTFTDGSIGVVMSHKFMADVERMDVKTAVARATRETINHLNQHFGDYENAEQTYKELSTVGRVMALINWLKGMNKNKNVEMDDFLSVPLPAFTTPQITKKMLAVSTISYPKDVSLTVDNIRSDTRVHYMSGLLDNVSSTISDEQAMDMAANSAKNMSDYSSPRTEYLNTRIKTYEKLIKSNKEELSALEKEIAQKKYTIDLTNEYAVANYNQLVDRYNYLSTTADSNIRACNSIIDELNNMAVHSSQIISIGGGIDLSPKKFKIITRSASSPKIQELNGVRGIAKSSATISKSDDWIKNRVGENTQRVNMLPKNSLAYSKISSDKIEHNITANSGDRASMSFDPKANEWEMNVQVNGASDMVKFSKLSNKIYVEHNQFSQECTGRFTSDGKKIVFSK